MNYEFTTEGMTCKSCVASITRAVMDADPKARVSVDLQLQKITVASDQKQTELADVIEGAGYPVKQARSVTKSD